MSCHGLEGQGFLEGGPGVYIGRPLNTGAFQIENTPDNAEAFEETRAFLYKTILNGREDTPMVGWGLENGGPLNYEMINELVALIMSGEWEMVGALRRSRELGDTDGTAHRERGGAGQGAHRLRLRRLPRH